MRKITLTFIAFTLLVGGVALAYLIPVPRAEGRERCLVEPRSPVELLSLVGPPAETLIVPVSSPRTRPYPAADLPPVESETISALTAILREAVACAAEGDPARLYALYSDDFLRRTPGAPATQGNLIGLPTVPVWRGSWLWDDGRVGAVFSEPQSQPTPDRGNPTYVIFVKTGDRWLIDDAVPFAE
ncbi:MAG: hypothetical protein ACRDJC_00395 [Thermomicrobiales bacterium]